MIYYVLRRKNVPIVSTKNLILLKLKSFFMKK